MSLLLSPSATKQLSSRYPVWVFGCSHLVLPLVTVFALLAITADCCSIAHLFVTAQTRPALSGFTIHGGASERHVLSGRWTQAECLELERRQQPKARLRSGELCRVTQFGNRRSLLFLPLSFAWSLSLPILHERNARMQAAGRKKIKVKRLCMIACHVRLGHIYTEMAWQSCNPILATVPPTPPSLSLFLHENRGSLSHASKVGLELPP